MSTAKTTAKKPRKSAKQSRFDRQVFHARRLLRELEAVELRPATVGLFGIAASDEWLLQTAYGPAQIRCATTHAGALWLQIRMDYSALCAAYGIHYKQGVVFDRDQAPEEIDAAVGFKFGRLCRPANIRCKAPTAAELEAAAKQFIKSEEDRAVAWCELLGGSSPDKIKTAE